MKFRFHAQILESAFLNVYCGLNLYKFGVPLWDVLGNWRQGSLPQFTVSQAAGLAAGIVNTPPPFYLMKYGPCVPTPKGKCHICMVKIRKGIREKISHLYIRYGIISIYLEVKETCSAYIICQSKMKKRTTRKRKN